MTASDCRQRASAAREHLAVAHERIAVASLQPGPSEMAQVAASNAVLAGIAAADALCGSALGECSNEQDHRTATAMLRRVKGAEALAQRLQRLLADKTSLQYGGFCTDSVARAAVAQAETLVEGLSAQGL